MKLQDLMVDTKSVWLDYPGCSGFKVKVANLSRKEMIALRKRCINTEWDKKTRQPVEQLDEQLFVKEFTKATIKGWKGFKLKYLESMVLTDLGDNDPEAELPYSQENAEGLVENATDFDTWVNEVVFDLDNFRKGTTESPVGEV